MSAAAAAGTVKIRTREKYNWWIFALLLIGSVTVFFPLFLTVIIAFKSPTEMGTTAAAILSLPESWSFTNFAQAIETTSFFKVLFNSVVVTAGTLVLVILTNAIVAYGIARNMDRRFFRFAYFYFISGMFVPFAILMLPLVKQASRFHLANLGGLIILYMIFNISMNVLLYTGYLKNIPTALEEAAYVDGASSWTVYWRVIFPLLKPMHATVAVLTSLATWNDVLLPLVMLSGSDDSASTLPLAQLLFQSKFGTNYNVAFASYLLAMLPILIFYCFAQKHIISGVANGAIKG